MSHANVLREDYTEAKALLETETVDLPNVAGFVESVYRYGAYAEPKDYNKKVKFHIKAVDAKIVLAVRAALLPSNSYLRTQVFRLADIRAKLDGHHWRAERIIELMEKRRVA